MDDVQKDAKILRGRQAPPTPPASSRRRTASTGASSTSTPTPASPKVLVKLNGRVYRPRPPDDLRTKAEHEADMLLSEPNETVEDLETERREKRRKELEVEMQRERMREVRESPSNRGKGRGRMFVYDSDDDDLDIAYPKKTKAPAFSLATPTKSPRLANDRPVTPPPRPSNKLPLSPSPSLGLPFAFQTSSPRASTANPLPAPLASLLSLHSSIERALIMHLSTAGSIIASSISDVDSASNEAKVKMANLIDLPTLTRMLESSGKRFGENDLRRLVWVWQGAGGLARGDAAEEAGGSPKGRNTVVLGRDGEDEVGGMGFVVSRARVVSTSSSAGPRVSQTYGLGIYVSLRTNPQLPKLELVSPSSGKRRGTVAPPSPSSVGKGRDGMSIVALWTQGKEQRRKEVERRLRRWAERQVKTEEVDEDEPDSIRFASTPNSVPLAALPLLTPAVPAIPSTTTASPKKPTAASIAAPSQTRLPVVSPANFVDTLLTGKPVKAKGGSVADRDRARWERIQAKQAAHLKSAYHASFSALSTGESSPTKRSLKRHAGLIDGPDAADSISAPITPHDIHKRNAMMSRLGSVADVVAMRLNGRPMLFEEVCTAVANSPLLAIGFDEADQSITFLAEHFSDFCYTKMVGRERWLYLRGVQRAIDIKELVKVELAKSAEALHAGS
ncbi:hypothetical protein Rt10032_c09g3802 [Rhodotorula toruloides]|uniref:DNA replication factor Cdt1 C-terminal domain-containing protein n=1 Tax=Rhodotorula toruloides TaxID=5286 RepID=A0A511KIQ4_RHOTO|nr:hypothetical protein Rt10032_c09g3802 [Rhodotorula toruloides]